MEVREATAEDIPAIVGLLRMSLGESLMPKSERYWRWKHLDNPFGSSPVLLCFEGTLLVGVRAFMRWEWIYKNTIFQSVRAVDTATHPDYQGKGIFRKLTMSLVESCKEKGVQFVFNTPNDQSRPGYLKMGWELAGPLPIRISVQRPFRILKNVALKNKGNMSDDKGVSAVQQLDNPGLNDLIRSYREQTAPMVTNLSVEYFKWRYESVPVAKYVVVVDEEGKQVDGMIVARVKDTRIGRELRITDCLLREGNDGAQMNAILKRRKSEWGIDYTTFSGSNSNYPAKIFSGLNVKAAIGPKVTVRPLYLANLEKLKNFNEWAPSLGDLELF